MIEEPLEEKPMVSLKVDQLVSVRYSPIKNLLSHLIYPTSSQLGPEKESNMYSTFVRNSIFVRYFVREPFLGIPP